MMSADHHPRWVALVECSETINDANERREHLDRNGFHADARRKKSRSMLGIALSHFCKEILELSQLCQAAESASD